MNRDDRMRDDCCGTTSATDCLLNQLATDSSIPEICQRCDRSEEDLARELRSIGDFIRVDRDAQLFQKTHLKHSPEAVLPPLDTDRDQEDSDANQDQSPIVGGRYQVMSIHAHGGLGMVSKAKDRELRRVVALKEIQPRFANSKENRARFLREAKITGRLEHPGIVPIYSVGQYEDGRPYYAMRMIDGVSLRDAIIEFHSTKRTMDAVDHSLRLRSLIQRFASVCDALSYAHSQGVLHRDIKPDNIMLGKHGETLLVDWGLATRIGQIENVSLASTTESQVSESVQTEVGRILGTLLFMSPEQAAGNREDVSEFSDIFSMGATLFAILTGEAPYNKSADDLIGDILEGRVRKVRDLAPMVSPPLAAICERALAAKPSDRYIDAREMAEDLERWLADEPVLAYTDPIGAQVSRFTRRHRSSMVIGVIALGAIALASLVSLVWVNHVRTNTQTALERSERLRLSAELRAYAGEIGIAQLAVNSGLPERAASALAKTSLSYRGWEFQYLSHQATRDGKIADDLVKLPKQDDGFKGGFNDAVFVAGDDLLATVGDDSRVRVWRTDTNENWKTFDAHGLKVFDLDASPDGLRIASASTDRTIRIVNVKDPKQFTICEGHSAEVRSVCFSPDGAHLVSASSSGEIYVWNPDSGDLLSKIKGKVNDQISLDVDPHSDMIVVAGERDAVDLFRIATGQHLRSLSVESDKGGFVRCVRFSPDGTQVIAGGDRKMIRIWDVKTSELRTTITGHTDTITSVQMSANGDRILSASLDGTVRLWDPITAQTTITFSDSSHGFKHACFSDDGSKLLWVTEGKTMSLLRSK